MYIFLGYIFLVSLLSLLANYDLAAREWSHFEDRIYFLLDPNPITGLSNRR